jgi:OOP family OmpA-OmpF porin
MRNFYLAGLVGAMVLIVPGVWAGEGPGFYGGGSVGLSHYEDEADDIDEAFTAAGFTADVDSDTTDLGWKIFGGYRFTPNFGAEVGYIDLGEQSVDVDLGPLLGTLSATNSISGVSLAGTAGYPVLPKAYMFGKLGGFIWDSSAEGSPVGLGDDDNGVDLTFGIGGTYELVEHVKVRAEWERFQGLGDDDTDIDLFTGGIQYDF